MRNYIITGICLLGAVCFSNGIKAQTDTKEGTHTITIAVPEFAIVDVEPAATNGLTMGFTEPTEAGEPITAHADDNSLWLNYSSIVTSGTNKIEVKLDKLIGGVDIKLTAAAATGTGDGTRGTTTTGTDPITLSTTNQKVITGIGSAYTGDGPNGHNLTYNVSISNYANLVAATAATNTVTVTYTIGAE